jgi:hypothetical protein
LTPRRYPPENIPKETITTKMAFLKLLSGILGTGRFSIKIIVTLKERLYREEVLSALLF